MLKRIDEMIERYKTWMNKTTDCVHISMIGDFLSSLEELKSLLGGK